MSALKYLNIVSGGDTIAGGIFESLFPNFMEVPYSAPSEYVHTYWDAYLTYCNQYASNANQNGKVFELVLATLLIRENLLPFFLNARVAFVPNVIYDIILYSAERGPICISAKTSLRERYKQADLEGIALKYVHRRSLTYLVTNSEGEANGVRAKIQKGDVIGLDDVVYAHGAGFDALITSLKQYRFEQPQAIQIINSNQVVTPERVQTWQQG